MEEEKEDLPANIAQLRRELKFWRVMAICAMVWGFLLLIFAAVGCEAPDSMYVRSTTLTPVHILVDNPDEFPAGGSSGDMLKADYDPDEDGIFVLDVLTGDVIDVSETAWAVSAMGAKANGNPLNHDRYLDSEAVSAMGAKASNNPLNHDRYTDAEAKTAGATNKLDDLAAPDNNTDLNATTSAHGLLPILTGVTTVYLNGNGAWTTPAGGSGLGYCLTMTCNASASAQPGDSKTYYWGTYDAPGSDPWTEIDGLIRLYILKAGTIKVAYFHWNAQGTDGTNENISVYIRLNASGDTLIETIGDTAEVKIFNNNALGIAVVEGDYIQFKMICPAWATNPTTVWVAGFIYIE